MRKVSGPALHAALIASCLCAAAARGDGYASRDSHFGMNLPQTVLPNGADEIRTSDGTSCRSAVGGDGTYADFGVMGSPDTNEVGGAVAVYGRVVVPFGGTSERLDCTKLYDLEIQRLKMELHLARMGVNKQGAAPDQWAREGWSSPAAPPAAKPKKKSKR